MFYCYNGAHLNNPRWPEEENWSGWMLVFEISSSRYDDSWGGNSVTGTLSNLVIGTVVGS